MHHSPIHRLFFALRPPAVVARGIAADAQRLGRGAQPPERLHLTLFILADLLNPGDALIAALRRIGEAVALAPFEVTFDRLVGHDGYIALRSSRRNAALAMLYEQLAGLVRAARIEPRPGRRFHPHVSMVYRGGGSLNERVAPVGWVADELVLIDSHVGATRHELLGHWPLVSARPAQLALF